MTPLEFLLEDFESVKRALKETLRYDFVPERSERYYTECKRRIATLDVAIKALAPSASDRIGAHLFEVERLASWISLIERSHLGEFSWPFAEELDRLASALLFETNMKGERVLPIVHVIASGSGYRITYEPQVPSPSQNQRFVVVEFPRSLKHHVLLHAIFGHELCHTAIHTSAAGGLIHSAVVPSLKSGTPFETPTSLTQWLHNPNAPPEIKAALATYFAAAGAPVVLTDEILSNWLIELICDLFGLLLFGPAFLAAHRALLRPMHPMPYQLQDTHPPYAVRHRMLTQAMKLARWNKPVTADVSSEVHAAETMLLEYVLEDPYSNWASIFTDAAIDGAISGIRSVFSLSVGMGYAEPSPTVLAVLMQRLRHGLPPQTASLDQHGKPQLQRLDLSHVLYAGWASWLGRTPMKGCIPLKFFEINRLSDLALLQQQAINLSIEAGIP